MDKKVILEYIKTHPGVSSRQIEEAMNGEVSLATVKRMVNELMNYYLQIKVYCHASEGLFQ